MNSSTRTLVCNLAVLVLVIGFASFLAFGFAPAARADNLKVSDDMQEEIVLLEGRTPTSILWWCYSANGALLNNGTGYNFVFRPNGSTVIFVEEWGGPVRYYFSPAVACVVKEVL